MDDESLTLALGMQENRGAYALLLGSGVSTSAGILTGWEIGLDLIRRVAMAETGTTPEDPVEWYRKRFGEDPDYSSLLELLGPEPAERMAILQGYIEPSEEDRQRNLRVPTRAHELIARLVREGYIRVIVTTNFDRLMEEALAGEGIAATVVSSDDDVEGAAPLVHTDCTVIKLHGDYLDTRIRNTMGELSEYSPKLAELLKSVLNDFGLVIVGWSGQWDVALRDSIRSDRSSHYSYYWCVRSALTGDAESLRDEMGIRTIQVSDADAFFTRLSEHLESLSRMAGGQRISTTALVETVKRMLPDNQERIRLEDVVREETEAVVEAIASDRYDAHADPQTYGQEIAQRLESYEQDCERLLSTLAVVAYYSDDNADLLRRSLIRLASVRQTEGLTGLLSFQYYPSTLAAYTIGVGALTRGNANSLAACLIGEYREPLNARPRPLVDVASHSFAFRAGGQEHIPRPREEHTPASNHIYETVRHFMKPYVPDDHAYEESFETFEYLVALTWWDVKNERPSIGRIGWHEYNVPWEESPPVNHLTNLTLPILGAGLFGGSQRQFAEAVEAVAPWLKEARRQWTW